jgi:hypothetical protein
MASEQHLQRVPGYIDIARNSNARLVSGGGRPADQDRGWFVEPTVFADVATSNTSPSTPAQTNCRTNPHPARAGRHSSRPPGPDRS